MQPTRLATLLLATGLTGCAGFLPQSGPGRAAIVTGAATVAPAGLGGRIGYTLVPLDATTVAHLGGDEAVSRFSSDIAGQAVAAGTLGVGDTVGITIFEAASGGLFIPSDPGTRSGNYVTLPLQQIGDAGDVTVPFAGAIHAAGATTAQVEREIDHRLAGRALDPQAIVTVSTRQAGALSVTGEVGNAAHFALDPGGETVLGAIARAGGPRFPAYETTVTLQRNAHTEHALLSEVMQDPAQNVALRPGDAVYLAHTPRYFLAFGATGPGQSIGLVNRRFAFDDGHLSLADALAKAGGLEDDRANAQAIFVYRLEPSAHDAPPRPTVYQLDLTSPGGYFYANQFRVHNEDTLFVSNSPSTDLTKLLALVLPAAYSASGFRSGF